MPAGFPLSGPGADFELAEHFRWTWGQLQDTPLTIRRLWFALLMVRREVEAERAERQQASAPPTDQDRREAQDTLAEARAAVAEQEARRG